MIRYNISLDGDTIDMITGKTDEQRKVEDQQLIKELMLGKKVYKVYCRLADGRTAWFTWVWAYLDGHVDMYENWIYEYNNDHWNSMDNSKIKYYAKECTDKYVTFYRDHGGAQRDLILTTDYKSGKRPTK